MKSLFSIFKSISLDCVAVIVVDAPRNAVTQILH